MPRIDDTKPTANDSSNIGGIENPYACTSPARSTMRRTVHPSPRTPAGLSTTGVDVRGGLTTKYADTPTRIRPNAIVNVRPDSCSTTSDPTTAPGTVAAAHASAVRTSTRRWRRYATEPDNAFAVTTTSEVPTASSCG